MTRPHLPCPVCGLNVDRVFLRQHVGSVRCLNHAKDRAPLPNATELLMTLGRLNHLLGLDPS